MSSQEYPASSRTSSVCCPSSGTPGRAFGTDSENRTGGLITGWPGYVHGPQEGKTWLLCQKEAAACAAHLELPRPALAWR